MPGDIQQSKDINKIWEIKTRQSYKLRKMVLQISCLQIILLELEIPQPANLHYFWFYRTTLFEPSTKRETYNNLHFDIELMHNKNN